MRDAATQDITFERDTEISPIMSCVYKLFVS